MHHQLDGTGAAERARLLRALSVADERRESLHLDLSSLDAGDASKRRLLPWWVAALSNLLLGRYANLGLIVTFPLAPSIRRQLLRNGFFFALKQRSGSVQLFNADAEINSLVALSGGEWAPGDGPTLFELADGAKIAERLYLYANTQRRAEEGYFRRYEPGAAFRWLGEILPHPSAPFAQVTREQLISATSDTFVEVLENLSGHAFNLRNEGFTADWLGRDVVTRARSCLLGGLTEGGTDSFDRLHFVAIDNGFGIARTLRWQEELAGGPSVEHDAGELVSLVLQRRLGRRGIAGHNGAGLWYLHGLARIVGGVITVLTEDDQSHGTGAVEITVKVPPAEDEGESEWLPPRYHEIPVRGTIIRVQLRVPRLDRQLSSMYSERYAELRRFRMDWRVYAST